MEETPKAVTELEAKQLQYEWIIKRYSSFNLKPGEYLESPEFFVEIEGKSAKFQIRLFPEGYAVNTQGFIAVFIYHLDKNLEEIMVKFRLEMFNSQGKFCSYDCRPFHFLRNAFFGTTKIISKESLFCYIHDDTLKLVCDTSIVIQRAKYQPPMTSIIYLPQFYMNGAFSDVTISVSGREFTAHKLILAARSPVFSSMFSHPMIETNSNRVNIVDSKPEVFAEFLKYIYTGNAEVRGVANELLTLADKYDVQDLKSYCEKFMANNLTIENCFETLVISDLHAAHKLKQKTIDFIVSKSPESGVRSDIDIPKSCLIEVIEAFEKEEQKSKVLHSIAITFHWTINNVSLSGENCYICSPKFWAQTDDVEKWAVMVIPKNKHSRDDVDDYYLGADLNLCSPNSKFMKVKYTISFENLQGERIASIDSSGQFQAFKDLRRNYVRDYKIMKYEEVQEKITGDTLKVICDLEYMKEVDEEEEKGSEKLVMIV